jgi:hypothetical protein
MRAAGVRQANPFDGAADLLGDDLCAAAVGVGQHRDKLLTAVAGKQVGHAVDDLLDSVCDDAQALVARDVAVEVVKALEVVHVDHQQGERAVVTHGAAHLAVHDVVELAAVGDAGQAVHQRQVGGAGKGEVQLVLRGLAAGDIARHLDEADGLAGLLVTAEPDAGLHPDVVAVLVPAAVGRGFDGLAAHAAIQLAHQPGDVLGKHQLAQILAGQLPGQPSQHVGHGRRNVAPPAVQVSQHDDVVGRLGKQAEARLALLQAGLPAADLGDDQLNPIDHQHGDSDKDLQANVPADVGVVAHHRERTFSRDGEEAAHHRDQQQPGGRPGQAQTEAQQQQERRQQEEAGKVAVAEDSDGRCKQQDEEAVDLPARAIEERLPFVQREVERHHHRVAQRVRQEPALERQEHPLRAGVGHIKLGQERRDPRSQQDAENNQAEQLAALRKIGLRLQAGVDQGRGQANLNHVAAAIVGRLQQRYVEQHADRNIDGEGDDHIAWPLAPPRAQQDADQQAVRRPQDSHPVAMPALHVQQAGCHLHQRQRNGNLQQPHGRRKAMAEHIQFACGHLHDG